MWRSVLALAMLVSAAHAGPLPHEYEDLGACQAIAYTGKTVVRTHDYDREAGRLRWERTSLASSKTTFVQSYAYDRAGRLVSTSMDGDHTVFAYDPAGRVISTTTYDQPSSPTATWVWKYRYDAQGRQVQTTAWSRAANAITIDKRFEYDAQGRLAKITLADGTIETRTYDTRGLLVRSDEVAGTRRRAFTYKYDARKRRIEQTVGDARIEYRYDCKAAEVLSQPRHEPSIDVMDHPDYCGTPKCRNPRGTTTK